MLKMDVSTKTYQNKIVLLDDEQRDLMKVRWYISKCGKNLYVFRMIDGKKQYLHRVILGAGPGQCVDHINHNTLDNRIENLRICSSSQNMMNSRKKEMQCSSKYKGVHWCAQKRKWKVELTNNKKRTNVGFFNDETEAALSYNKAAKDMFGEFAYLNNVLNAQNQMESVGKEDLGTQVPEE